MYTFTILTNFNKLMFLSRNGEPKQNRYRVITLKLRGLKRSLEIKKIKKVNFDFFTKN